MKYLVYCCLLTVMLSGIGTAQTTKMTLGIEDESDASFPVSFGVDPFGTDGIDNALGEKELPGLGEPSVLFAAFIIPYNPDEGLQKTYSDIRKSSDSVNYRRVYQLDFGTYRVGKAKIIWTYPLPQGLDSVRLIDRRGNGKNVNIHLDKKEEFIITNEFWDSFLLYAYYNKQASDVTDNTEDNRVISFSTNGRNVGNLSIGNSQNRQRIAVMSILGEKVLDETLDDNLVELPSSLSAGNYVVVVYDEVTSKTVVKTISLW